MFLIRINIKTRFRYDFIRADVSFTQRVNIGYVMISQNRKRRTMTLCLRIKMYETGKINITHRNMKTCEIGKWQTHFLLNTFHQSGDTYTI